MNNVKTKFVIAISQKLAAAPDSDAKVDLIEELSENLFARYQDMIASGMPEQEAYSNALDKLGDVNELLAYLDCCDGKNSQPGRPSQDTRPEDWFSSLGDFIQQTVNQAMDAANDAAAIVRDGAKHFAYNVANNADGRRVPLHTDDNSGEIEIPSENLKKISVSLAGDLSVYLDSDPNAPIRFAGDTEDLLVESNNDTLTVIQDKSAGGSFFFSRGLSSATIELTIPQRYWDHLEFTTGSGDLDVHYGMLEADSMVLKTTSGDMELGNLHLTQRLVADTSSGELFLSDSVCGELLFHSASGDLDARNLTAAVLAQTASGDVSLSGEIRAFTATSASGDLQLNCDSLPDHLELATKSGDCSVHLPDSSGFVFRFSTVSGELHSDFPLTADAATQRGRLVGRAGQAYYKDGGDGRVFTLSSVSGDIELRKN